MLVDEGAVQHREQPGLQRRRIAQVGAARHDVEPIERRVRHHGRIEERLEDRVVRMLHGAEVAPGSSGADRRGLDQRDRRAVLGEHRGSGAADDPAPDDDDVTHALESGPPEGQDRDHDARQQQPDHADRGEWWPLVGLRLAAREQ